MEMPIEYLIGDKAYDGEEIHRRLILEHGVRGIIPPRGFEDVEEGKTVFERDGANVCFDLEKRKEYEMVFWKSQSLKYGCPHSVGSESSVKGGSAMLAVAVSVGFRNRDGTPGDKEKLFLLVIRDKKRLSEAHKVSH